MSEYDEGYLQGRCDALNEMQPLREANAELTRQVEVERAASLGKTDKILALCNDVDARDKTIELAFAALDRAHEEARKARYRSEPHVCDYRTAVDAIFDVTATARCLRAEMEQQGSGTT